jgi:serine protein kinase
MYTFEWVDEKGELQGLLGKDVKSYQSPMHEEPLLLIPDDLRPRVIEELNRGNKTEFRINIDGELSPPSRYIFRQLMEKYHGDVTKVLPMCV